MNVATFAISAPQVSAIISSVRARVLISMPLLTNMSRGKALSSRRGRSVVSVSLDGISNAGAQALSDPQLKYYVPQSPQTFRRYRK